MNIRALLIGSAILGILALSLRPAGATECPSGVPSCKILFVTPEMEHAFAGPNMIGDHATWANRAGMAQIVDLWKKALAEAPRGEQKKSEPQSLENKAPPAK